MKILLLVSRVLLGLMFVTFGLNGFLHFIPQPPPPGGHAGEFMAAVVGSHYMALVFLIQFVGGVLLLANRYVPLALTLLAPVIVNILLFHITMDIKDIPPGIVVTVLWLIIFSGVRSAFSGILAARTEV